MYMCFSKTPALSPTGDARPFSLAGDGTILGEGLGVLTLKRLDDARRDGDRIYAVIKGIGASSDGKGNAVYAPSAAGQAKCLRRAYESAGVSPDTIELVEAHGTGTKVGDAVELSALAEVYRSAKAEGTWCALGSVKSQIGHTKAAAGAAGLIKAALALHHKVLPPTIKVDQPGRRRVARARPRSTSTPRPAPGCPSPDHPRRAAVSAFGFGGSNFHCVLEEADPEPAPVAWDGDVQILAYLRAGPARRSGSALGRHPGRPVLGRRSGPRRPGRGRASDPTLPTGSSIVAERGGVAWPKLLDRARALLAAASKPVAVAPEGVYLRRPAPSPAGWPCLFPGQGSQYVGMLRDLACRFPEMLRDPGRRPSGRARSTARPWATGSIPIPRSTTRPGSRPSGRSGRPRSPSRPSARSAWGPIRVLEGFGLRPDAVAGHSFGELTALRAAGRIDERDFFDLARLRGRLMAGDGGRPRGDARRPGPDRGDRGDPRGTRSSTSSSPTGTPRSSRSSRARRPRSPGPPRSSTDRGSRPDPLEVSAAFHSRFVADASGAAARSPASGRDRPGLDPGLRQHDRRALSRPTPTRPGRSWPSSSPGRSGSSSRSRRWPDPASGPSSKSAPTVS